MQQDFYSVLGVGREAADKEVRAAYRKLARKFHPDVNPGNASGEATFKKINEAYEVLSDPKSRKDYDEFGENWKHAAEMRSAGARGGAGPGDFRFFSSGGRSRQSAAGGIFDLFNMAPDGPDLSGYARRQPQRLEAEITLDEAYHGTTRLVAIDSGQGRPRKLEVKVPAGIADGGKVMVRPGSGPEMEIVVKVLADPRFRRDGADLHTDVPTLLLDAVLGGEVRVPTMTGEVALKVTPGTQNGRNFRLAGKGMPRLGSNKSFGDLYATVKVVLPESISEERTYGDDLTTEERRGVVEYLKTL